VRSAKVFHLGDMLTLATGVLLAPTGLTGYEALLAHLLGREMENDADAIESAQGARNELFNQHPWLVMVVPPATTDANELVTWFAHQVVERHGYHEVLGPDVTPDAEDVAAEAIETADAASATDAAP